VRPPARRLKRLTKISASKRGKPKTFGRIILSALLIGGFFFLTLLTNKFYRSNSKVALSIKKNNGDLLVSVFDPLQQEITNITIPSNTQLTCSRQLGIYKAKSIWQLGENNNLGGNLMKETIIKTFHFPINAWADSGAEGLASGRLWPLLKSVFSFYKSNLGVGDRLRIAFFSLGLKNFKRVDINLAETMTVKKTKLIDGEEGYLPVLNIPEKISVIFSDSQAAKQGYKLMLKDATGKNFVAEEVGKTIEVLGVKVAFVSKENIKNSDCFISGKEDYLRARIAQVFSCEVKKKKLESNFDFELEIGEKFAERF
jgi:hypothetical protein